VAVGAAGADVPGTIVGTPVGGRELGPGAPEVAAVAAPGGGGLSRERAAQLRERVAAGEPKAALAREFGLTRQSVYNYLAAAEPVPA